MFTTRRSARSIFLSGNPAAPPSVTATLLWGSSKCTPKRSACNQAQSCLSTHVAKCTLHTNRHRSPQSLQVAGFTAVSQLTHQRNDDTTGHSHDYDCPNNSPILNDERPIPGLPDFPTSLARMRPRATQPTARGTPQCRRRNFQRRPTTVHRRAATDRTTATGDGLKTQRPTTNDQRPTTNDQRPTTNDQRPTANDQRPTTTDHRPTTNDQRPPTNDERPNDNDQRPTTNDQRTNAR